MQWYYAQNGQRLGPYGDADFAQLVNGGQVLGDTLVWHEGMANWQAYSQVLAAADLGQAVAGSASSATAAAAGRGETKQVAFCSQCGRYGVTSDMIAYEGSWVCPDCKETFFQRVREGLVPAQPLGAVRYAGFWIRFAAHIIDSLVVGAANFIIVMIIGLASLKSMSRGSAEHPDAAFLAIQLIGNFVSVAVAMTYETWMVGAYGATLGKMACGLRIIRPNGQKVAYGRACARYWAKWLNLLTLLVGYIMAGFTDQKRALHDIICDTRVIWK